MNSSLIDAKLGLFLYKHLDTVVLNIPDKMMSLFSCGKFDGLFLITLANAPYHIISMY